MDDERAMMPTAEKKIAVGASVAVVGWSSSRDCRSKADRSRIRPG